MTVDFILTTHRITDVLNETPDMEVALVAAVTALVKVVTGDEEAIEKAITSIRSSFAAVTILGR